MSHAIYPPLDVLKPVADGLWIVDSGPLRALGMPLPVRMSVVRLDNGDIWLHSPTRYDPALHQAIAALGPIRHLVAPNVAHWTFLKAWQDRCPDALTWAAPNLGRRRQVRRSGLRIDRVLSDGTPGEWVKDFHQLVVPGGLGFREVAFVHIRTSTLLLTDLVLNLEAGKMPVLLRPLLRLAGMTAPHGMPPPTCASRSSSGKPMPRRPRRAFWTGHPSVWCSPTVRGSRATARLLSGNRCDG